MRDMILFDQVQTQALDALRLHGIEPILAEDQWDAAELRSGHPEAIFAYGPGLIPQAATGTLRPVVPRPLGDVVTQYDAYGAKGVASVEATPLAVLLVHDLKRGGLDESMMQQAAAVLGVGYVLDLVQIDAVNFLRIYLLGRLDAEPVR